jgi:transcriptional regulator with XRE-family HTH domain/mannose-6-phosphate isomerase-like protein (cupin superfamily)
MDFPTIGARVRERRQKFGMSAQALADRAGVARYTLIRLEAGKPCRPETVKKIRKALRLFSDQMTRPFETGPFAVYRACDIHWSVSIPKEEYQKRLVDDDPLHVDDPAERARLGSLGFQPFFTAILGSGISDGVGHPALMELYKASWVDQHFGEEFVYCLRGTLTITVDGVPCTLEEGDSMTFDALLPHQYLPDEAKAPVLILLVVSFRPGERTPMPS